MPLGVPFVDSGGFVGSRSAEKAPQGEIDFTVRSTSKSLAKIKQKLSIEFKDGNFRIKFRDLVIGEAIRVNQKDMKRLAAWITEVTSNKKKEK